LYDISIKLKFAGQIFEKYLNFVKIRPVGAELFHADRRTDMTKLIAATLNFANAPKEGYFLWPENKKHVQLATNIYSCDEE